MMSIFKDEMFLIFVMISRSSWFGHNIRLKSILFFSFSISTYKITCCPTRLHEMVDLKPPTRNVSSIMKEISSCMPVYYMIFHYRKFVVFALQHPFLICQDKWSLFFIFYLLSCLSPVFFILIRLEKRIESIIIPVNDIG